MWVGLSTHPKPKEEGGGRSVETSVYYHLIGPFAKNITHTLELIYKV